MGARHAARRLALQALYALEMNQFLDPADAVACAEAADEKGKVDRDYLLLLATAAWENRKELDAIIGRLSKHWKLNRMDRIDKCILRLAAHELLHVPEIPSAVVINEGVDLAKEFGAPDSASFINGILDSIANEHRARKDSAVE